MHLKFKFTFIYFFALLAFHGYAQNESIIYKNQLKFSPVKMVDVMNPGVEISYERRTGKLATQISAAYLTDIFGASDFWQIKGYRIGIEKKYFTNSQNKRIFRQSKDIHPYLSTELNYSYIDYKFEAKFGEYDADEDFNSDNYLDTFGVKKQKIIWNIKYGLQKIHKRFVFDVSFGIGLKYKNVKHYDRSIPTDKMENSRHLNVFDAANKEMNGITFNLPASIKIGYVF